MAGLTDDDPDSNASILVKDADNAAAGDVGDAVMNWMTKSGY